MAAFATVEELADYTRKAIDPADASAEKLLDVASAAIRSFCRRSFDLVTDDVVVLDDPVGVPGLLLPELPVTAVSSVETWDGTSWTALADESFGWDSYGRVWLTGEATSRWPTTARAVRVTYSHGYTDIPDDIRGVCLALAGRLYSNPNGYVSQSVGNWAGRYGEAVTTGAFTDMDRAILGNYRLVTVA